MFAAKSILLTPMSSVVPITFGAAGTGANNVDGSTASWSQTDPSGSSPVVWVASNGGTWASVSVTYGGSSMTLLASQGDNNGTGSGLHGFGLIGAGTGSAQTVVVTMPGTSASYAAFGDSFNNVKSFGTPVKNFGLSGTASVSVSSATGKMVAAGFGTSSASTFSSYTQTNRYNANGGNWFGNFEALAVADAAGASTVAFSATLAGSSSWSAIGIPLN